MTDSLRSIAEKAGAKALDKHDAHGPDSERHYRYLSASLLDAIVTSPEFKERAEQVGQVAIGNEWGVLTDKAKEVVSIIVAAILNDLGENRE